MATLELRPHHPTRLSDIVEEEYSIEDQMNKFVSCEDEKRWRCQVPDCRKLFISYHFWLKHVNNRHAEWLEQVGNAELQDTKGQTENEDNKMPSENGSENEIPPNEIPKEEKDDVSMCGSWDAVSEYSENKAEALDDATLEEMLRPTLEDINEFFEAAERGDIDTLQEKLDQGLDIEEETTRGFTALSIAILEMKVEAVEFLLQRGADPNHRVRRIPPLVHAATRAEHGPKLVQLLLDRGVNINTVSGSDTKTALHWAVTRKRADVVEFLIGKGMDIEKTCRRGCTPLLLAAETGSTEAAEVLLEHGAKLDVISNNGGTALIWSSCNNHVETMKFWLEQDVDIDAVDNSGLTSLFLASHFGNVEAVKLLLEKGADPSILAVKPENFSVVMAAACSNQVKVLKVLIEHGCDLDVQNWLGETALDVAITEKKLEATQVLLEAMSRGSYHPKDSVSLQLALAKGHFEVKALMSAAALMYPYVGFKFESPGEFAWMEWVLNEGGVLVKPRAMRKLLHAALEDQNIGMLKALITQGCDINAHVDSGHLPLSFAVQLRNIELIEVLLDAGADPSQQSNLEHKYTPLDEAIIDMTHADDTEIVDLLLETGRCLINKGQDLRATAFSRALRMTEGPSPGLAGKLAMRMLNSVKDVNEDRREGGYTLLHIATLQEREDFVDILLRKGADINAVDKHGCTPFLLACQASAKMVPILIERGADIHAKYQSNATAIVVAAAHGNLEALRFLVNYGMDIEAMTERGWPPLACALTWQQEESALYLMSQGANVFWETNDTRKSALHFAARYGLEKAVEELLRQGLASSKDSEGWTPLHKACATGTTRIVEMLLDAGADIELELPNKDRPLHIALINEREDIASLLLERGACITALASNSRTPLHLAAEYNLPLAATKLLDMGASTEAIDSETWTPLCCCGFPEIVDLLIKRGANVNYEDKDGWTPLHQAVFNKELTSVGILMRAGAEIDVRTTDDGLNVLERAEDTEDEKDREDLVRWIEECLVHRKAREIERKELEELGDVEVVEMVKEES